MKKILLALSLVMGLVSCDLDKDIPVIIQEMMNIDNDLLVNDSGVKYSIKDPAMSSKILSQRRVFMAGTAVKSETAGYDFLLSPYDWYGVAIQNCVTLSTVQDVEETLGSDPVGINQVWSGGGYINALTIVSYEYGDENFSCAINMVFDDTRSTDTDLYFILKNKQVGKNWSDDDLDMYEVEFGSQYFSFPYEQYLKPGFKGDVTFHIEWEWFDPSPYTGEVPYRTVSAQQGTYTITVK